MSMMGMRQEWFSEADEAVVGVAGQSNGPLFTQLLEASGHTDVRAAEMLRVGAQIVGVLCHRDVSAARQDATAASVARLRGMCHKSNGKLIKQLKTEEQGDCLLELSLSDARLGRLSEVGPIEVCVFMVVLFLSIMLVSSRRVLWTARCFIHVFLSRTCVRTGR